MPFVVLLVAALLAAADQFLGMFVVSEIKPVGPVTLIPGFLSLDYTENTGAAFSMMPGARWFFIAITALVCALIIFLLFRYERHEFFSIAASALIVGGGIGNMIDRILREYVVDYIHISFFPAIFNLGDCCVVVGDVFFIIHVIFFADRPQREKVIRRS